MAFSLAEVVIVLTVKSLDMIKISFLAKLKVFPTGYCLFLYIYMYFKWLFSSQKYIFDKLPCLYLVRKICYYDDNQKSKPIF